MPAPGDARQRLIEAKSRFDADHQQIERVGQRQANAMLPRFAMRASSIPGIT